MKKKDKKENMYFLCDAEKRLYFKVLVTKNKNQKSVLVYLTAHLQSVLKFGNTYPQTYFHRGRKKHKNLSQGINLENTYLKQYGQVVL